MDANFNQVIAVDNEDIYLKEEWHQLLNRFNLDSSTVFSIGIFSILWCLFEQEFFNSEVSALGIIDWAYNRPISKELSDLYFNVRSDSIRFLGSTDEFTIINRIYSDAFKGSEFQRSQIYSFLNDDLKVHFSGCMLYIQRIRNNLFHGIKDVSTLNNQKEMFDSINRLLKYVITTSVM